MVLIILKNQDEVISELSQLIKKLSDLSIASNGVFNVGVSGGSLGNFLKIGLPGIETDFSKWRIFFCDERVVPENDSDSTFGYYKKNLIKALNLKEEQFVTIQQHVSVDEAAEAYYQQMTKYFPKDSLPRFDLLLLGMGPDGHTCSLFPDHALLEEKIKWVAPISDSPKPPPCRITLTLPVINNAKNCIFAVCGKEKAEMVKRIIVDKADLPCARVKPVNGELYWILDAAAGELIK